MDVAHPAGRPGRFPLHARIAGLHAEQFLIKVQRFFEQVLPPPFRPRFGRQVLFGDVRQQPFDRPHRHLKMRAGAVPLGRQANLFPHAEPDPGPDGRGEEEEKHCR
jgi:hypothetical protein